MCTHRPTTVPLAVHNPINGGNEEKEQTNVWEIRNEWTECTNQKESDGLCDGWVCLLLSIIVSQ